MKKIILCDGDSWTAGDIVDPEIFGDNLAEVNHVDNRPYRLPKVWPNKLGKLLNIEVDNFSVAGSSNDGIVRRTIAKTLEALKKYDTSELFVIVGWSSPERKDFYFKGEWNSWETLYPAQLTQSQPNKDLEKFYKIYLKYFWNEEEYMSRYIQHNLYLHYFLKSKNIDHLFFSAFYETKNNSEGSGMFKDIELYDSIITDNINFSDSYTIEEFSKIHDNVFKKISFRRLLMEDNKFRDGLFGDDFHPTERAHQLWAEELYKDLKDKI